MAWYLAPSLSVLRSEVNSRWPKRDKTSDGTIGDPAHQATRSDHNPNIRESVDAWDLDKDGVDVNEVIAAFQKHPSAHYWIFNREIADKDDGWRRRPYTGSNPHDKHAHFSIRQSRTAEQDTRPWGLLPPTVSPGGNTMALDGTDVAAIWLAGFGKDENRRTAGELLSEARKLPGIDAKLNVVIEALQTLATSENARVMADKLNEIDDEATAREAAQVVRHSELVALINQVDDGTLTAQDVVDRLRVTISVQPPEDEG